VFEEKPASVDHSNQAGLVASLEQESTVRMLDPELDTETNSTLNTFQEGSSHP
jgi:hypothetical protein